MTTTDGNGGNVPWDPSNSNDALVFGGTTFFGRFRQDEIEQKALFGEATFDFAERWQIKGGLRWFDIDLTSIQGNTHNFGGGASTPAGEIIGETVNGNLVGRIQGSESSVNPMAALSYNASEEVMIYGLYSEGFRTGGVNNSNQPFTAGIPPIYQSDKLKNFELGLKSRFLDNRMQLNATLFHIDWSDIQVEPRDPAGNIGAYEAALLGTPMANAEQPLEILRTIHSFDPCVACATHVMSPDGKELSKVKVR